MLQNYVTPDGSSVCSLQLADDIPPSDLLVKIHNHYIKMAYWTHFFLVNENISKK
jgi:hypothetical protein